MSYALRWAINGPNVFDVNSIYINTFRDGSFNNLEQVYHRACADIISSAASTRIQLKRCKNFFNESTIENLRSYMHIPFPPFYIVEEGNRSAIGVSTNSCASHSTRLVKFNYSFLSSLTWDMEIVTSGVIEYLNQPNIKLDYIEFSLGVVEKPKKSKYIEVSCGERSIIVSRRKNGAKRV
jgi:hypothetical protein